LPFSIRENRAPKDSRSEKSDFYRITNKHGGNPKADPSNHLPGDQTKNAVFPRKRETASSEIASGGGIISLRRHDPDQVQRVIRSSGFSVALATPRCAGPDQQHMTRPFGYGRFPEIICLEADSVVSLSDAGGFGNRKNSGLLKESSVSFQAIMIKIPIKCRPPDI
jgi:hypothetical protein